MIKKIRAKLADRLAAKGLETNETDFFIQDSSRGQFTWIEYRVNQGPPSFIGMA